MQAISGLGNFIVSIQLSSRGTMTMFQPPALYQPPAVRHKLRNRKMFTKMEYNLRRNAQNFINESLNCIKRAESENEKYPFAISHLIQGLELTLKSLLYEKNEILVYDNIDTPSINKTVSISTAINRLSNFKIIQIDQKDKLKIEKIVRFRNQITHFQFNLDCKIAFDYYLNLFEFIHYFYSEYLETDLHDIITKDHWQYEAELLSKINKSGHVHYHGELVYKEYPKEMIEFQKYNGIKINGKIYDRIKFGEETTCKIGNSEICGDCSVRKGFYHTDFCDHEQCPRCGEQLIGFHSCIVTDYVIKKQKKIEIK
jgi:hypothetical protein